MECMPFVSGSSGSAEQAGYGEHIPLGAHPPILVSRCKATDANDCECDSRLPQCSARACKRCVPPRKLSHLGISRHLCHFPEPVEDKCSQGKRHQERPY